jgi:hypothetical protein
LTSSCLQYKFLARIMSLASLSLIAPVTDRLVGWLVGLLTELLTAFVGWLVG